MTLTKWTIGLFLATAVLAASDNGYKLFQQALAKERADDDPRAAIHIYERVVKESANDRKLAAQALVRMAECYHKLGDNEARKLYERVVRDYTDQKESVATARARLAGATSAGASPEGLRLRHFSPAGEGCMPQPAGARLTDCHRPQGIFIRDLASGQERLVVPQSRTDGRLLPGSLSPDEKTLTYFDLSTGLRAVGLDGSGDRLLAKTGFTGGAASMIYGLWTRDGKHLLLPLRASETDDKAIELVLVAVADGSKQVLRRLSTGPIVEAVLSPDEKLLAFMPKPGAQDPGVLIASVTGGEPMPLTGTGPVRRLVGWHPSGHIVYTSDQSGGAIGIWAIPVAQGKTSGERRLIHATLHPRIRPWVGRDGAVHFEEWNGPPVVKTATLSSNALSTLKPATDLFTEHTWSPHYSRDGKKLVYATAYAPGTVRFVVQDLAATHETAYYAPLPTIGDAVWYPDGSALLVHGILQKGEKMGLHRLVPQTGESKRIVDGGVLAFAVAGQDVYYRHESDKPGVIRQMNLISGAIREITLPGTAARIAAFEVSSDGKRIALVSMPAGNSGEGRLTITSLSGGDERLLMVVPRSNRARLGFSWTPTGDLLFTVPREDGSFELRLLSANGGEPVRVYSSKEEIGRISVHPNGRDVALATRDNSGGRFWLIENAFGSVKK